MKLGSARLLVGIWRVSVELYPARPEVPYERATAGAKNSGDLHQTSGGVGPMVHRQRAHDEIERSVGERQRGHVADDERWPAGADDPAAGVGPSPFDHGRIEIETGDVEAVLPGEQERQPAGPAPHLEDPRALGGTVALAEARAWCTDPFGAGVR